MQSAMTESRGKPSILSHVHAGDHKEDHHKSKLANFLSSRTLDIIILALVLADVLCVSVESAIDLHVACVGGVVVPMAPGRLVEFGNTQTALTQADNVGKSDASLAEGSLAAAENLSVAAAEVVAITASGDVENTEEFSATMDRPTNTTPPASVLSRSRRSKAMRPRPPPQGRLESLDDGIVDRPSQQRNFTPIALLTKEMEEEETRHPPSALVCDSRHGPKAHHIAHTAHKFSIYILVIFTLELFLKIYVNPRHFFGNCWEVLDLVVVLVSLALDTVVEGYFEEVVEVLICCRLWRVVRIVHGFIEIESSDAEYINELKEELERTKERCEALEKKVKPSKAA